MARVKLYHMRAMQERRDQARAELLEVVQQCQDPKVQEAYAAYTADLAGNSEPPGDSNTPGGCRQASLWLKAVALGSS
jgi:hypothetical protein